MAMISRLNAIASQSALYTPEKMSLHCKKTELSVFKTDIGPYYVTKYTKSSASGPRQLNNFPA